jgi:hypothetical protein
VVGHAHSVERLGSGSWRRGGRLRWGARVPLLAGGGSGRCLAGDRFGCRWSLDTTDTVVRLARSIDSSVTAILHMVSD